MLSRLLAVALIFFAAPSLPAARYSDPESAVEAIRHRAFPSEVARETITRAELRPYLEKLLQKGLPLPAMEFVEVLEMLHLVEKSPDTLKKLLDLYENQVLAFYDPSTHIFYSIDAPPSGLEMNKTMNEAVVVHELTHALQDQLFKAGARFEALQNTWDEQMAYQSVLEGEATLVMMGWLFGPLGHSMDELIRNDELMASVVAATDTAPPPDAPPYFVKSMSFPYVDGLRFVVEAYRRGGWKGVDQLHSFPPTTSEQILHPETYFDATPALPSPPSSGKAPLLRVTFGEFHWRFLLGEAPAAGWGGDEVHIVKSPAGLTILADTWWDTEKDAKEFAAAYRKFLDEKQRKPLIAIHGKAVRVAYGPDTKAGKRFTGATRSGNGRALPRKQRGSPGRGEKPAP